MMYCVLYYDLENYDDKLREYCVEAIDCYEAERLFLQFANGNKNLKIYAIGHLVKQSKQMQYKHVIIERKFMETPKHVETIVHALDVIREACEKACEEFCDHYCIYREDKPPQDEDFPTQCQNCPLNEII